MSRHLRSGAWAVLLALSFAAAAWGGNEKRCPNCGRLYDAQATYCLDDGTRLVAAAERCPTCGTERAGSSRFCGSCGYSYDKPKQPEPTAQTKPPAERTCPKCNRKATPGTKFCSGCGATLPAAPAGGGGSPAPEGDPGPAGESQWAAAVVAFSSQMGTRNFAAEQIVGPPDVQRAGKDGKAWVPSLGRRGEEWITVRFARPVVPRAVRIYETAAQGFVVRIHVVDAGREVLFWEGEDRAHADARILEAASTVVTGPIDTVKITIDTKKVRKWTEIDAVELIAAVSSGGRRQGVERIPPRTDPGPRDPLPGARTDTGFPTSGGATRFESPEACFEAWKRAILARDAAALAQCYTLLERVTIEQERDVAQAIFARYGDGLRRNDFRIEARRGDLGGELWEVDLSVRDGSLTHRVKENFRFREEAGSWRIQVERGG